MSSLETTPTPAILTFGLSDFKLIEVRKPHGPQLQFTFTVLAEVGEKQLAVSIPGIRYAKRSGGEFKILPPTQRKTEFYTYYSAIFTNDMLDLIEETIVLGGWKKKVGSNNIVENLLKIEGNLLV